MKLEIAAGMFPQKLEFGWLRHDVRELPDIDIVCDWRDLADYRLVEEIYCRHFIEHLSVEDGLEFLEMCHGMLMGKGKMTIVCPNMKWLCSKYLDGDYADSSEFVCWMFGGGDEAQWSYHRSGYDDDLLCRAFRTVGFNVESFKATDFHLEVCGVKG